MNAKKLSSYTSSPLNQGHLSKKDSLSCPKNRSCMHVNMDTSLKRTLHSERFHCISVLQPGEPGVIPPEVSMFHQSGLSRVE